MSRPLRIEYPDAWYHVMNRGRRSEEIFFTDIDRKAFITILQEAAELWNFKISRAKKGGQTRMALVYDRCRISATVSYFYAKKRVGPS